MTEQRDCLAEWLRRVGANEGESSNLTINQNNFKWGFSCFFIYNQASFIFFYNRGIRGSLHAPRLIF